VHPLRPDFWMSVLGGGVWQAIFPDWPRTASFLITASQVAETTDVSPWHSAFFFFFFFTILLSFISLFAYIYRNYLDHIHPTSPSPSAVPVVLIVPPTHRKQSQFAWLPCRQTPKGRFTNCQAQFRGGADAPSGPALRTPVGPRAVAHAQDAADTVGVATSGTRSLRRGCQGSGVAGPSAGGWAGGWAGGIARRLRWLPGWPGTLPAAIAAPSPAATMSLGTEESPSETVNTPAASIP
jgi:hypothetical protein